MARITTVKSARKSPGSCQVCEKEIHKGDSYLWWAFYRGAKNIRCLDHKPKRSETTGSETESMALQISEGLKLAETPDTADDADSLKADIVEEIEAIKEVIQEKMDNIEGGFGHTDVPSYYDQEELLDAYQSWGDEIDGLDTALFGEEADVCTECDYSHADGNHETGDDGRFTVGGHYFGALWEFWGDDFMSELRELVDQGAGV